MIFQLNAPLNSSINFKIIHFLLWIKVSYQNPNFETFKCFGENLPNSFCYFSNHKLVFSQILHLSLVSWKITPLYFFSSNTIYFSQMQSIKLKIFETFECSGQSLWNSPCQFWNDKSIPLHFFHYSPVSLHITSL